MNARRRLPQVVFVDHVARLSGAEIALLQLTSALEGVVVPRVILGEDGPLVSRLRAIGVPVEVLPLRPGVRDLPRTKVHPARLAPGLAVSTLTDIRRLRRRLSQLRPDIVHTNSLKAALYGGIAARLAGVPVVWHIRDRISADYLPRPAVELVRALAQVVPSVIVANSQSTLATVHRRRRSYVVHNHVILDSVQRQAVPARRRPNGPLTIGVVGRLSPWKGQHVFLDAFAAAFRGEQVRARVIGAPLFGEHDYERSLVRQADDLGVSAQVEFRGFREDVWGELQQLDVLVHCSTIPEPFGQVVLEGMAIGMPIIAADAGGPRELIQPNVNGLLTPPGDVTALARALQTLVEHPADRARLGAAAQRRSLDFTPEKAVRRLTAIYDALLHPVRADNGVGVDGDLGEQWDSQTTPT